MKVFKFLHEYDNFYDFNRILSICKEYTSYVTMTEQRGVLRQIPEGCMKMHRKFMKEMEPFLVKKFDTTEWYSYYVTSLNKLSIYVFEFNEATLKILNSYINSLFLITENEEESLNLPEDICFFRNDSTMFLGTVSHEHIAEFYLTDQEYEDITLPCEFAEIDKSLNNYDIVIPI